MQNQNVDDSSWSTRKLASAAIEESVSLGFRGDPNDTNLSARFAPFDTLSNPHTFLNLDERDVDLEQAFYAQSLRWKKRRKRFLYIAGLPWKLVVLGFLILPIILAILAQIMAVYGLLGEEYLITSENRPDTLVWIPLVPAMGGIYLALFVGGARFFAPKNMLKIVILRPFHEVRIKEFRKAIKKSVSPLGFCFTLSDKNFRPNLFHSLVDLLASLASPFTHGAAGLFYNSFVRMFRPSFRLATVVDHHTFNQFVKQTRKPRAVWSHSLSYFWSASNGNVINIRSSDPWWKATVGALIDLSEAVIMDISSLREGSEWEIKHLVHRGKLESAVFVARDDCDAESLAIFERLVGHNNKTVFRYGRNGKMNDEAAFQTAILQASYTKLYEYWLEPFARPTSQS